MFIRILTFVFLVTSLGGIAQAGVIRGIDADSATAVSVPDSTTPENGPQVLENSSQSEGMSDSSVSTSSTSIAMCFVVNSIANVPCLIGFVNQEEHALPPSPILDGLIRPA